MCASSLAKVTDSLFCLFFCFLERRSLPIREYLEIFTVHIMGSIWNVSYRGGAVTNIARQAQNHLQGTSGCCARILGLMPKALVQPKPPSTAINGIPFLRKWWSVATSLLCLVWCQSPRSSNWCIGCQLKVPGDHVLPCGLLRFCTQVWLDPGVDQSRLVSLLIQCNVLTFGLARKWSWYASTDCLICTYQINFDYRILSSATLYLFASPWRFWLR